MVVYAQELESGEEIHTGSGPNPLQNTGNGRGAKCKSKDKNNIMKQLTNMDLDRTRKEMDSFVRSERQSNNQHLLSRTPKAW